MKRAQILEEATKCVCGKREQDYGKPEDNFQTIANFWSEYLGGITITAKDVAMMMALMKIARVKTGTATEDSFVDIAGYAACGGEIAARSGRYPWGTGKGFLMQFNNLDQMMKVRDDLLRTINNYGYATVADLRNFKGDNSLAISDFKLGWTAREMKDIKCTGDGLGNYILILSDPVKIKNCDNIKGDADFLLPMIEAFNGFAKCMAADKAKKGEENEQNGQLS